MTFFTYKKVSFNPCIYTFFYSPQSPPYVKYLTENPTTPSIQIGNNNLSASSKDIKYQLEGFLIDYLEEMARIGDFRYSIRLSKDNRYGHQVENTNDFNFSTRIQWTGMVGELLRKVNSEINIL